MVFNSSVPDISIHAPTRGATVWKISMEINGDISIHAPTRGATIICRIYNIRIGISIHAPTRGATLKTNGTVDYYLFQSTLPREERRCMAEFNAMYQWDFNPRSHERSDMKQNYIA